MELPEFAGSLRLALAIGVEQIPGLILELFQAGTTGDRRCSGHSELLSIDPRHPHLRARKENRNGMIGRRVDSVLSADWQRPVRLPEGSESETDCQAVT